MRAGLFSLMAATALFAVACGSGDDSSGILNRTKSNSGSSNASSNATLDPKKADAQAHASLIKPAELPGTGWQAGPDDDFTDDAPNAKECNDYGNFRAAAEKDAAGKAKRDMTKDVKNSDQGIQISLTVIVYDNSDKASSFIAKYKPLAANNSITNCLNAAIKDEVGSTAKVNVKTTAPAGNVPNGGMPLALDLEIPSEKASLRAELYAWNVANSDISVSISGPKEAITPDVVNAILQKSNAAAQDAAAGKRS